MTQPDINSNPVTIKNIDLSHMPTVEIKQADGKRSYGRRFVVIVDGQASKEMVFKKMLKQIDNISKLNLNLTPEEKLAQLKSIQTLLGELKGANVTANETYKTRGLWYKFRTFFHRLGNRGSHENKLDQLEQHLSDRVNAAESSIVNPPIVLNSKSIETFIEDNLPVFQASVKHQRRKTSSIKLTIDDCKVKIQDKGAIHIDTGKETVKIQFRNGKAVDSIPDELVPILQKTFEAVITNECQYSPIRIIQSSLAEFPLWHLQQVCNSSDFLYGRIEFLDDTLHEQEGLDAGGLKRAYISTLVESIQNQVSLFTELQDGLKCPRINRSSSRTDALLNCTENEAEVYSNLGRVLLHTYASTNVTGVYFNDMMFQVALEFNRSQLNHAFTELTKTELIQIAKSIVEKLPLDTERHERDNMLLTLNLCDRTKLDECLDQEDQVAALKAISTAALVGINDEGMEAYLDDDFLNANIEAIKADRDGFIEQLYLSVFSSNQFITQLNGSSLGEVLSPIYSMARGMVKETRRWDSIQAGGYENFSLKTQGGIDRQFIHDAFELNDQNLKIESEWLKEWVLSDATNEDIRNFLRFVGGSTSLPQRQKIHIAPTSHGTYPISHSCSYMIELPRDLSKETFIANLKEAILVQDFGMY